MQLLKITKINKLRGILKFRLTSPHFNDPRITKSIKTTPNRIQSSDPKPPGPEDSSNLAKIKRFVYEKSSVFIPVHLVTTSLWFLGLYFICSNGINVLPLRKENGMGESLDPYIEDTTYAVLIATVLLMKVMAPFRFGLSIGVTLLILRTLKKRAVIPKPSKSSTGTRASNKKEYEIKKR